MGKLQNSLLGKNGNVLPSKKELHNSITMQIKESENTLNLINTPKQIIKPNPLDFSKNKGGFINPSAIGKDMGLKKKPTVNPNIVAKQ